MDNKVIEEAFVLGRSLKMLDKESGILSSGTTAYKRLLKYAQNPDADYEMVSDFIFSIFYNDNKRFQFDFDALFGLRSEQLDDCMLVLRLNSLHPERYNLQFKSDLLAWKLLELARNKFLSGAEPCEIWSYK